MDQLAAMGHPSGKRQLWRRLAACGCILFLGLTLGAWRISTREGINPSYVARIQDGKTTKHEILLWFGDPKEVDRGPDGVVFKYVSYRDEPPLPSRNIYKDPEPQITTPFYLDEEKKIKETHGACAARGNVLVDDVTSFEAARLAHALQCRLAHGDFLSLRFVRDLALRLAEGYKPPSRGAHDARRVT